MASINFMQNTVICSKGEQFRNLLVIKSGSAEATLGGHVFKFGQGDFLGLDALSTGVHSLTYTATSDVTIAAIQYEDIQTLKHLFQEKEEMANLMLSSMCRQVAMFLEFHAALKKEAAKAYDTVTKVHPLYEKLCTLYAFASKKLPAIATLTSPVEADDVAAWVHDYYIGIHGLEASVQKSFFSKQGIIMGFILGGTEEIVRVFDSCAHYQKYLESASKVLLSPTGFDLLSLVSELHIGSATISGADAAVDTIMTPILNTLSNMRYIDKEYLQKRLLAYKEKLNEVRGGGATPGKTADGQPAPPREKKNLANSLSEIMEYAGYPQEQANKFVRLVQEYTKQTDRSSSEDVVHRMRRELTNMFNEIYKNALVKYLADPVVSTVIKMFLNFGYMDAALAGYENADYLYSIADTITGDPDRGIYTATEWLAAIYNGKREPCRNEFDQDYPAYVAELKQQKRFDAAEEARLLADREGKLMFELENIFPIVNKLTYGRITIFCPVFSDNNVQRGLEDNLITADGIREAFNDIRAVDYAAFYRETVYTNPEIGINREAIHVEIMPEVILMPNVGVRGIMWQEIEGRKRTTPARMFVSLFCMTELKPLLVRLTGEFRWEMCKRVQGSRWQDVTEPSLTAEYVDYLQFYRHNRDLSTELKAGVKSELTRARNNYKSVFASNYSEWVLYESAGSPRLNKVARKIMMTYCTFPAAIRGALAQNPQYAEPLKRYVFKAQQREHYITRVIQKLVQVHGEAPQELHDELAFSKA